MASTAPSLILGSMRFGDWGARLAPSEVARLLAAALDLGIDTPDLDDIYAGHTTPAPSVHPIEVSAAASQALDDGTHAASLAAGAEVQAWPRLGGGALPADAWYAVCEAARGRAGP